MQNCVFVAFNSVKKTKALKPNICHNYIVTRINVEIQYNTLEKLNLQSCLYKPIRYTKTYPNILLKTVFYLQNNIF